MLGAVDACSGTPSKADREVCLRCSIVDEGVHESLPSTLDGGDTCLLVC